MARRSIEDSGFVSFKPDFEQLKRLKHFAASEGCTIADAARHYLAVGMANQPDDAVCMQAARRAANEVRQLVWNDVRDFWSKKAAEYEDKFREAFTR